MKLLLLIFCGCLLPVIAVAQTLSGRIIDAKGQSIPRVTMYIKETSHGIIADENGEFKTNLEKGDYTCELSSLGYERKTVSVFVPEEGTNIIIELTEKIYGLNEIIVTPGKEDPAYNIMRNVISRAPFHLNQVKSYESEVYLKGSFKIDQVPALIRSQIKDKELKSYIGRLLLYESQSEIKYNEPDKYDLRITAISSAIPQSVQISDNVPLGAVSNNIYSPTAFGGLLASGSFSVYKFELEDSYRENELLIYKIRVISKKRNNELVNGWLYIAENTWTIRQADLNLTETGVNVRVNMNYNEIKPGAFLPSAYDVSMRLNLLGIKGGGQFYASIKYNQLETNANYILAGTDTATIIKTEAPESKTITKQQQKDIQKLEELASKDNLTTREAYRMAQLAQKTVESEEIKNQKRQLEVRPLSEGITIQRDSLALLRDSSFWNMVRTVPLQEEEFQSFIQRDSMKIVADSLRSADSLKNRSATRWAVSLLLGENIKIGKHYYIKYEGVLPAFADYNFVDGFRMGQRVEVGVNFNDYRSVSISPAVYYVTARQTANIIIDGKLTYAPMRNGKLSASVGRITADFAGNNGTDRFVNTLSSLFMTKNTAKFYYKKYLNLSNIIEIATGLILTTSFNYEKRHDLENNTSFSFFGNNPVSNRPHGYSEPMPSHKSLTSDITLQYTPRHYYRILQGHKVYRNSDYPTIRISYKKGFGDGDKPNASFDNVETTITQSIKLGLFDNIFYEVNAGMFLSAKQTYLPDFKHFRTNEMFLTGNSFNNSFNMDNYVYATNDKWLQAHLSYSSQYLLLKQIPFMQGYLFNEALHIGTLWTPTVNYNQAGYSIGFGNLGRLGVFAGFKKTKFDDIGVTVAISL